MRSTSRGCKNHVVCVWYSLKNPLVIDLKNYVMWAGPLWCCLVGVDRRGMGPEHVSSYFKLHSPLLPAWWVIGL